jgi:hypothetical protein
VKDGVLARARGWRRPSQGMPARFGLVALGAVLLWQGVNWTAFPDGKHGRMFQVLPGLVLVFAAIACCVLAGTHVPLGWRLWRRYYARCGWVIAVLAILLSGLTLLAFDSALYNVLELPTRTVYINDVISFTHVDAQAVLAGHNPYTDDAAFTLALRRYPKSLPTPLRRGAFGTGDEYPTRRRIEALERAYLDGWQDVQSAFDPATLHSYPALSFLLYVPLIWAGLPDILLLHLLLYCAIFAWLLWLSPPRWRVWAALAAGASFVGFYSLSMDSEVVCVAFILAAWHWREGRWLSAIALGLGCAFKQYCWFFAPFLLLEALYTHGWREALKRTAITGAAFLLPNAPFLLANARAWGHSLLLPVASPLFPMGIGPISLSTGHLLPYGPPALYSAVELAAFGAMLWLQWRYRSALGASVLVLALVPLLFAFRSPANYFAFIPWLALYAACMAYQRNVNREGTKDTKVTAEIKGTHDGQASGLIPVAP